jgi:hypothetical protein
MVVREALSLHAMLHKDMQNEVPESVLNHCAESDKVLVENLLRLAQAELSVLNLASTTIVAEGKKTVVRCALTGPTPSVSLSNMRALQAYSPARVVEVRIALQEGSMMLVFDVCDSSVRMSTTELEIVRITKRHRTL